MRSVFSFQLLGEHLFDLLCSSAGREQRCERQIGSVNTVMYTVTHQRQSTGRLQCEMLLKWTGAFPLPPMASASWSTEEINTKLEEICSDKCRSKTGNVSPYCSVISGQSGVVICRCSFNYKAGKIKLSNKRPLLSSLTSKNCSRRRWRRRQGVHQHGP